MGVYTERQLLDAHQQFKSKSGLVPQMSDTTTTTDQAVATKEEGIINY